MDLESRFHSLIQPIRDLASNWDVDIAESLENYLGELERLRVNIDGNSGGSPDSLNFAEAALLIQGSTAIYSKKVEYLHQLVLQALEVMSNKSGSNSSSSKERDTTSSKLKSGSQVNSIIDDERLLFGSDPTFLLLDDVLEEGSNIQVAIDPKSAKDKRRSSGRHSASGDLSSASMVLMHSILQEDHGGSCLKMSTCHLDASGALLIGGSLALAQTPGLLGTGAATNINSSGINNDIFSDDNDAMDGDDDGNWGGTDDNYDIAYPDDVAAAKPAVMVGQTVHQKTVMLNDKSRPNPLTLMDPHDGSSGSKAVVKGRPFKIPSRASTQSKHTLLLGKHEKNHSSLLFERILAGNIPLSGLTSDTFKDVLKFERIKRFKSNIQRAKASSGSVGQLQEIFLYREVGGNDDDYITVDVDDDKVAQGVVGSDDIDDDDDVGGFWGACDADSDFDTQQDDDVPAPDDAGGSAADEAMIPAGPYDANRALARILAEEDELARRVENALNEGFNNSQANTYEALCRKHIDSFMRGAEQYRRETQLSRRVADWTTKLEATLRAQEEATPFDIHVYSGAVMSSVQKAVINGSVRNDAKSVAFAEVAGGRDSAEVCRVFLACLQLVNAGSLSVSPTSAAGEFSVQLVSSNVTSAIKRMDAFMAASSVSTSQLLEM